MLSAEQERMNNNLVAMSDFLYAQPPPYDSGFGLSNFSTSTTLNVRPPVESFSSDKLAKSPWLGGPSTSRPTSAVTHKVHELQQLLGVMQSEQQVSQQQLQWQTDTSTASAAMSSQHQFLHQERATLELERLDRMRVATRAEQEQLAQLERERMANLEREREREQDLERGAKLKQESAQLSQLEHVRSMQLARSEITASARDDDLLRERCATAEHTAAASLPAGLVAADLAEFAEALSALGAVQPAPLRELGRLVQTLAVQRSGQRNAPSNGVNSDWQQPLRRMPRSVLTPPPSPLQPQLDAGATAALQTELHTLRSRTVAAERAVRSLDRQLQQATAQVSSAEARAAQAQKAGNGRLAGMGERGGMMAGGMMAASWEGNKRTGYGARQGLPQFTSAATVQAVEVLGEELARQQRRLLEAEVRSEWGVG